MSADWSKQTSAALFPQRITLRGPQCLPTPAGETGAASHGAECPTWESVSTGEPTKVVGNTYTLDQRLLGAQDRSEEDFPWVGPVGVGGWGPGIIEAQ